MAGKKTNIKLNKFHSTLKGKALVPPMYREIDFSDLSEEDKKYLVKHKFAEKVTKASTPPPEE